MSTASATAAARAVPQGAKRTIAITGDAGHFTLEYTPSGTHIESHASPPDRFYLLPPAVDLFPPVHAFYDYVDLEKQLIDLLHARKPVHVNLFGAEAVGKTLLAARVAHGVDSDAFGHGIQCITLDNSDWRQIADKIAHRFYRCPGEMLGDGVRQSLMRGIEGLIILDLAPGVSLRPQDVEALLGGVRHCSVLLVTREKARVPGVLPVHVGGFPPHKALAWFVACLGRALSPAERELAEKLAEQVSYHPRRLELIAREIGEGRVTLQSALAQVTPEGSQRILEIVQPQRGRSTRDAIRAACIRWNTEAWNRESLRVLSVLGAVEGAVSREALQKLARLGDHAVFEQTLQGLRDKDYVAVDGGRYRIDPAFGPLVRANLVTKDVRREVLTSLCGLMGVIAADDRCLDLDGDAILAAAVSLFDKVQGKGRDAYLVFEALKSLDRWLMTSGRWECWKRSLDLALRAATSARRWEEVAWAHHQLGVRSLALGDTSDALSHWRSALQLHRRAGLRHETEVTWDHLKRWTVPGDVESSVSLDSLVVQFALVPLLLLFGIVFSLLAGTPLVLLLWGGLVGVMLVVYGVRSFLRTKQVLYAVPRNHEAVLEQKDSGVGIVIGPSGEMWRRPFLDKIRALVPVHEFSAILTMPVFLASGRSVQVSVFVRYRVSDSQRAVYRFVVVAAPGTKDRVIEASDLVQAWQEWLCNEIRTTLVEHARQHGARFDVKGKAAAEQELRDKLAAPSEKRGLALEYVRILDVVG